MKKEFSATQESPSPENVTGGQVWMTLTCRAQILWLRYEEYVEKISTSLFVCLVVLDVALNHLNEFVMLGHIL